MKKIILYTVISLLFFGCKEEPKRTDFIIKGTANDVYNGVRVHLNITDDRGRDKTVETKMVVNNQFTFEGKVSAPTLYNITINSIPGKLPILIENSEISIDINKTNIVKSKITGSKSHNQYEVYLTEINAFEKKLQPINLELRKARSKRDMVKQDALSKQLEAIENEKSQYIIDYINENNEDFFSLYLIQEAIKKPKLDIEKFRNAYNNLAASVKSTKAGSATKLTLDNLYNIHMKTSNLKIGMVAPNFKAPNADDQMIALEDLKGKVTIIDFWAAWCGPCRRENPNVVKVYNEFHKDGLEIIGISLDGTRGQKDPKKAWLDAVEKDKLTWTQLSYLKYFNDPVAKLYNIQSIPATYILDKEGRIAAKNLRGNALRLKVAELLQK
ncbi:TlpA disulfide reductase family protein [Winogradskyella bathintestinalis]|uniref:TlpA disulfide reductase family protein n=1 Tax=Winogradskyella bathintestinalis TaxID=3035208 RepID=A0ABT7ZT81_9FLAO|nr:TlpA disulfide reductase family protein [Winogradskyella bathintestinalis]MDN3492229.1 TlpA disulfide reductase family protein [Winogradskyella bathintestinalis]